ncbi:MAG: hypothetical protein KA778_10295 [Burkholderiaceae bacterium]|jgi:hypothetical protein|nr:hypothetical protein [Burkholderiaceae bacterium]
MNEIPKERRRHRGAARDVAALPFALRALLALVLSSLLFACGPGTGGTGTGPDAGASAGPGDSLAAQGDLLGSWRGGDALAVFEPQRIRVQQGCRVFGFDASWSMDPLRGLDLALRSDSTATGPVSGGTVRLQVVRIDADRIRMTLSDAAGVVLIGPLEARRAPAQPLLSEPGC